MKRVCVFGGSRPGARASYREVAGRLGQEIARRGWGLVFGGGSVGVMGAVADGALAAGGEVIGVIPAALQARELAHRGATAMYVVGSMHERKARMAQLSSGFVALPGGMGTLDEFCEIVTWVQLGIHDRPCALLDVDGYWAGFLEFLTHAAQERFLEPEHRRMILVDEDPARLLDQMREFRPPPAPPWFERPAT